MFFEDMAVQFQQGVCRALLGRGTTKIAGLECDAAVHLDDGDRNMKLKLVGGDELVEAGTNSLKTTGKPVKNRAAYDIPSFLAGRRGRGRASSERG